MYINYLKVYIFIIYLGLSRVGKYPLLSIYSPV